MKPDHTNPNQQHLETDFRFPSGPWFGFYRQNGSQSRQRFTLNFHNGRISGSGSDPVNSFSVHGSYEVASGAVRLTKTYARYKVYYSGAAEGDGIHGGWEIPYAYATSDTGEFHIWPDELAMEQSRSLEAAAPAGA